jgi:Zn-finger nucleic acid-binding protein
MNCPVCKTSALTSSDLETNLTSLRCPACGGNWIQGSAYWRWLDVHGPNLPEIEDQGDGPSIVEPGGYIDCPECRFRMVKYLVGRGLDFTLDHCQGCKGIWLDRNEWEALKRRNLHDDLNAMLTAFWQAEAQKENRKKKMEQIYIGRFGADDYQEIKRVRQWLDKHPRRTDLLSYLTDTDPFDI